MANKSWLELLMETTRSYDKFLRQRREQKFVQHFVYRPPYVNRWFGILPASLKYLYQQIKQLLSKIKHAAINNSK